MDPSSLEKIDAFLTMVGQASLLEYYGITAETNAIDIENRIKARRNWSQAQQSNPKFRDHALWLIKNQALIRKVLLDEMGEYVMAIQAREKARKIEMLALFVRGSLVDGILTTAVEGAIRRQGLELGLSEDDVLRYIQADLGPLLDNHPPDLTDEVADLEEEGAASVPDYYQFLKVPLDATFEQIETAYRSRYRWARSLKDTNRAAQIYRRLDDAWRHLSDPQRRKNYNAALQQSRAQSEQAARNTEDFLRTPIAPSPSLRRPATGFTPPESPSAAGSGPGRDPVTDSPTVPIPDKSATARGEAKVQTPRAIAFHEDSGPAADLNTLSWLRQDALPNTSRPVVTVTPANAPTPSTFDFEVPKVLDFGTILRSRRQEFQLRHTGSGALSGQISAYPEWIEVSPSTFENVRDKLTITVTVHGEGMVLDRNQGRINIETTQGERATIIVRAKRPKMTLWFLGILGLLVVAGLVVLLLAWWKGLAPSLSTAPPSVGDTELRLWVDPMATTIWINGTLVGTGDFVQIKNPSPPGQSFELQIDQDGFETYKEVIAPESGQTISRRVILNLKSPMNGAPVAGNSQTSIPSDKIQEEFAIHRSGLDRCFVEAGSEPHPTVAMIEVEAFVNARGQVTGLDFKASNFPSANLQACLRRQFRSFQFPLLGADYALFKHTFEVPMPSRDQ